ncbi:MAG TPA: cupin domain-containing protein [Gammaproteobacteria bacterium]|nr:cupin domain-containing protein [Gammaproteobacteria bacterium]
MDSAALLGGLDPQAFLKRHWQKTPCLIRGAIPDLVSPISAEELAGLACEQGVEARIVQKTRRKPGWSVRHAPFAERDFTSLPARDWTLLVQDTDKYLPALAQLLDRFRFIPNWRIDDVMVSYAADGGGVGPHVDAYDVFLLQAQGFRRWSIGTAAHANLELPGLDLKQVRDFQAEQEWLLAPGDMLYLPPGVAHDGVAVGDCLTFSIGFRVPSDGEMLADIAGLLIERTDSDARYGDRDLRDSSRDPGLISNIARQRLRQRLKNLLRLDADALDQWFGCYITEPKPWLRPAVPRRRLDAARIRQLLQSRGLVRDPATNLCWMPGPRDLVRLFADGHCYPLPSRLASLAQLLCRQRDYPVTLLAAFGRDNVALDLFTELYNSGTVRSLSGSGNKK